MRGHRVHRSRARPIRPLDVLADTAVGPPWRPPRHRSRVGSHPTRRSPYRPGEDALGLLVGRRDISGAASRSALTLVPDHRTFKSTDPPGQHAPMRRTDLAFGMATTNVRHLDIGSTGRDDVDDIAAHQSGAIGLTVMAPSCNAPKWRLRSPPARRSTRSPSNSTRSNGEVPVLTDPFAVTARSTWSCSAPRPTRPRHRAVARCRTRHRRRRPQGQHHRRARRAAHRAGIARAAVVNIGSREAPATSESDFGGTSSCPTTRRMPHGPSVHRHLSRRRHHHRLHTAAWRKL